ncbi:hypothetical protein DNH61_07795 [Paenibacillus sambharensis]|uniref:Phage protein Gp138 N-terminal domain-containing protein n=1 Tax=Paenibacillus sambharensis TaxID=1803190 RepID=A0A2W1LPF0_9BACL|nr:Gp138 family membrane-puncturing spike protein [Paenibacillus sambharensis]PZD96404.1 hypothetical protein DNH61_07795 [Paenibacillus sambharensis]
MRNPDPASTLARLVRQSLNKDAGALHVALPCRVESYNLETCRATVQPLIRTGSTDPAPIEAVPALGQRLIVDGAEKVFRPSLQRGDTVLVVIADREIKNTMSGRISTPDSGRQHDLNDAIIVGVFGWCL